MLTDSCEAQHSHTVTDLDCAGSRGADTPKRSGKRARAPAPAQNPTRGSSGQKPLPGPSHAAALADRSSPKPKPRAGGGRAAPRRAAVSNTSAALESDRNARYGEAREAPAAKRSRRVGQASGPGALQEPAPAGRGASAAFAADARAPAMVSPAGTQPARAGGAAASDPAQGSSGPAPPPTGSSGAAAGAPAPGAIGSLQSPEADPGEDGSAAAARGHAARRGGAGAQPAEALEDSPSTASVPTSSNDADFRADAAQESSR